MKLLNRDATNHFLADNSRGRTLEERDKEFHDDRFWQSQFYIPVDAGKLLSLCRHLFALERASSWTLIIVENGGIWPSWEDRNLYRMIRKAHGQTTELAYGDGHFFESTEIEDLVSFTYIFSTFRYDFRIMDANREMHVFFSHDDFVFIQMAEKFASAFEQIHSFCEEWPEKKKTEI